MEKREAEKLTMLEYTSPSTSEANCVLDAEGHCITCSDEALPVRVLHVDESTGLARVSVQDEEEEVDVTLVEDVVPGDWLLIHGGVAIGRLDNPEASEGSHA